jgi:hypothetical protein
MHGLVAARLGDSDLALKYFQRAALRSFSMRLWKPVTPWLFS